MADLTYPNLIAPGQPATAQDVQENFDAVELFVDTEVVHRDGTQSMTAPLTLSGDPTQPNHAANKNYVDDLVPVGTMWDFAGTTLPAEYADHWALCDGSEQATTDAKFERLYQVIQYTWGGAGGLFNLPDYRDKSSVGAGTTFAVGASGGQADVPTQQHSHPIGTHTHPVAIAGGVTAANAAHGHGVSASGSATNAGLHGHNQGDGTRGVYNGAPGEFGFTPGALGWNQAGPWNGTGFNPTVNPVEKGQHSHPVSVSGSAANDNANHGHPHNITATTSAGSGNTGNTGTTDETNYHPYAACLKIIYLGVN